MTYSRRKFLHTSMTPPRRSPEPDSRPKAISSRLRPNRIRAARQAHLPGRRLSRPPEPNSHDRAGSRARQRARRADRNRRTFRPERKELSPTPTLSIYRRLTQLSRTHRPAAHLCRMVEDSSKSLLDQLDYVLMDALTLPNPDGTWLAIWQIDTHVDDEEAFMTALHGVHRASDDRRTDRHLAWPTFLPVPIAPSTANFGRSRASTASSTWQRQKAGNRNQRGSPRPRLESSKCKRSAPT